MGARAISKAEESIFSNQQLWVRSPVYDLSLVTGGAFFTLFVAFLTFQNPTLLPLFFWTWVIGFEGSHFWATFSRTYVDKKFRQENKILLFGSLVFFVFPALALWLENGAAIKYATLYGFFIFCWSLYHNARQHFGFLSIYTGKAEMSSQLKSRLTNSLYMAVCFAQAHFLLNFKLQGVFGLNMNVSPTFSFLVYQLPIFLSVFAVLFYIKSSFQAYKEVGAKAFMPLVYIGTCLVFYCTMFYWVAPNDQFVQNLSGVQTLMLIAIMNSLFHNIQYHAIVYHYGQKRYNKKGSDFGSANFINKGLISYVVFALILGFGFAGIVWNVGDWPNFAGNWNQPQMQSWAYILFFGIIGHHFYMDQKIWRPSKSKELKKYLN